MSSVAVAPLAREAALALGIPRLCSGSPAARQMLGVSPLKYPTSAAAAATLHRYAAEWWVTTSGGNAAIVEPDILSPSELVRSFEFGVGGP
jgi:hypothetical protein